MAEFCYDCAKKRGIPCSLDGDWIDWLRWIFFKKPAVEVCEDCGVIEVDPRGKKTRSG